MKLLTSPALRNDCEFIATPLPANDNGHSHKWWFCREEVLKLFGVPETAKKIWFEFHDRAAGGRYKVEALGTAPNGDMPVRFDDNFVLSVSGYTGRLLVRRLKRTSCYVECYYE